MKESNAPISLVRFESLLEAYGARLECWPVSERNVARAMLETSEVARALARDAQALDGWLSASPPALSPAFRQRLNEIPERTRAPLRLRRLHVRALWIPALGWGAAAALGLWLGAGSSNGVSAFDQASVASQENDETATYDDNERLAIFGSTLSGTVLP